jgi:hypothetical protein
MGRSIDGWSAANRSASLKSFAAGRLLAIAIDVSDIAAMAPIPVLPANLSGFIE